MTYIGPVILLNISYIILWIYITLWILVQYDTMSELLVPIVSVTYILWPSDVKTSCPLYRSIIPLSSDNSCYLRLD